jgi:hypothetical protein
MAARCFRYSARFFLLLSILLNEAKVSSRCLLRTSRYLANETRVRTARFLINSIFVMLSFIQGRNCSALAFDTTTHVLVASASSSSVLLKSSLVCSRIDCRSEKCHGTSHASRPNKTHLAHLRLTLGGGGEFRHETIFTWHQTASSRTNSFSLFQRLSPSARNLTASP